MRSSPPQPRLDILLPVKEIMTSANAGAIATIAHDMVRLGSDDFDFRVYGRILNTQALCGEAYRGLNPTLPFIFGRNIGFGRAYLNSLTADSLPDAIEVHGRCQVARLIARRRPDIPVFLYLHNDPRDMDGAKTAAERQWLLKHLAGIFCVSEYLASCFSEGLDISQDVQNKIIVVPNGVERRLTCPPQKTKTIVIAGRMVPEKGVLQACQALIPVLQRHQDWTLHIIGGKGFVSQSPSAYEQNVRNVLHPVSGQAFMHGFMDRQKLQHYQEEAGIIISPSLWAEPAGLTNLEALASGAALITTRTGGSPEYTSGRACLIDVDDNHDYENYSFPDFQNQLSKAAEELISSDDRRYELQALAWADFPFTSHQMSKLAVNARKNRLKRFTKSAQ